MKKKKTKGFYNPLMPVMLPTPDEVGMDLFRELLPLVSGYAYRFSGKPFPSSSLENEHFCHGVRLAEENLYIKKWM